MTTTNLRKRLKASIEVSKLMRGNLDIAYRKLKEFRKELKVTTQNRSEYLNILISMLEHKLDEKYESISDSDFGYVMNE